MMTPAERQAVGCLIRQSSDLYAAGAGSKPVYPNREHMREAIAQPVEESMALFDSPGWLAEILISCRRRHPMTADGAARRTPPTEKQSGVLAIRDSYSHTVGPDSFIRSLHAAGYEIRPIAAAAAAQAQADEAVGLLRGLVAATATCPDAMMTTNRGPAEALLWDWWHHRAAPALKQARAFLARHGGEPG